MFKPIAMPPIFLEAGEGDAGGEWFFKSAQEFRFKEWEDTAEYYEAAVSRYSHDSAFLAASDFINRHPIFYDFFRPRGGFPDDWTATESQLMQPHGFRFLRFSVRRINIATGFVDKVLDKNTAVRRYVETGPVLWPTKRSWTHPSGGTIDHDLSCYGPSIEDIVIKVAEKIYNKYGNDRRHVDGYIAGPMIGEERAPNLV